MTRDRLAPRLRWTVLGAGTAAPHPTRTPSGHLLTSTRSKILIDMGAGTLWRLAAAGVHWTSLSAICLSHAHLDHTLDLQALMFAANLPGHGRTSPLPIYLHPQTHALAMRMAEALGKWFDPKGFEVEWRLMTTGCVDVGDVRIDFAPVAHHKSSVGMRFALGGGPSICYSGDSARCDSLSALADGVDLAILECSTREENPVPGHMTIKDVAATAIEADVGRVGVVHRYPELDGVDLSSRMHTLSYDRPVDVCTDGWSTSLLTT